MSTDFNAMYREATQRGMRDFERGVPVTSNPHANDRATDCAARWEEGWLNAQELAEQDKRAVGGAA
jgi:hypothetical protein